MAKTKQKWTPRRVRSEEERGAGSSDFITLSEGEKFLGYALFDADPAKDDPGYYEYLNHWVQGMKGGRSVPCAGEDCPICEDGEKPRDVALTLWLVTKDENGNLLDPPELRIFRANSIVIKQLTEKRSEDEPIKGVLMRVSRLDDRGNYVLESKTKKLGKGEVKEALKDDKAPDFDQMVTSQLRKAMEAIGVASAMDDDDDDDEPAKSKKSSGKKSKAKKEEPDTNEWPDDGLDEETVTVAKVEKKGQWIEVESDDYEGTMKVWTTDDIDFDLTDLSKGDEVTVSATGPDDDGDYILSAEPETANGDEPEDEDEDAKPDEDDELPDAIEDVEFEVVSIDTAESTMEVKNEEYEFTLYFLDKGPASKVDFDDYEEGAKITVSAEKDSVGDMVATVVPEVVEEEKPKKSGSKGGKGAKSSGKGGKGAKTKGGKGKGK